TNRFQLIFTLSIQYVNELISLLLLNIISLSGCKYKTLFSFSQLYFEKIFFIFSKLILSGNERLKRDMMSLFRGANIEPFFIPTTPFCFLF
ncbi:hypothetical protein, partial [Winogradskyella sp. SM1960]|uniref:hypothetical protein n=1 Tax=Winogradskyella sp. SM1960 TaxID=2865955 RepID=UPI001CD4D612